MSEEESRPAVLAALDRLIEDNPTDLPAITEHLAEKLFGVLPRRRWAERYAAGDSAEKIAAASGVLAIDVKEHLWSVGVSLRRPGRPGRPRERPLQKAVVAVLQEGSP